MNLLIAGLVGFSASKAFYNVTHTGDFPETGRYAVGIVAVAVAMSLCHKTQSEIKEFLLIAGAVGAGVATARVVQ